MRLRKPTEGDELGVQMAPLIDCVFLLLIFFLCTSILKKPHRELAIHVPDAAVGSKVADPHPPFMVGIDKEGTVYLDREFVTLEVLREHIRRVAEKTPGRMVLIQAASPTALQHVVYVINLAAANGLTNVALAPSDEYLTTPIQMPPKKRPKS